MIKSILLVSLTLISFLSLSQDYELLENYHSPISAKNYTIGDSITIGSPAYNKNETVLYTNIFQVSENKWDRYINLNKDFSKNIAIVQKIYSNKENTITEFRNSVVLEVITQDGSKFFIPIDKAISSKEIIVYPNEVDMDGYLPFNKQNATILAIKAQNLSNEQAMLEFIKRMNSNKYDEWKNNEFVYEKEKTRYLHTTDSLFATVSKQDTILIVLPANLGNYSFDKESFPIVETFQKYSKKINFALSNESLTFVNFNDFSSVNVSKDRAEYFANSTKKTYEETRPAFVIIKTTLENLTVEEKSGGMNFDDRPKKTINYEFKIIELHCVDHSVLYYNYIGNK